MLTRNRITQYLSAAREVIALREKLQQAERDLLPEHGSIIEALRAGEAVEDGAPRLVLKETTRVLPAYKAELEACKGKEYVALLQATTPPSVSYSIVLPEGKALSISKR